MIIVAYKSRDEIGACLESLPQVLNDRAVEVVVVDNYPADGTSEFVGEAFPWVTLLDPGENLGFGAANNLGFEATRGECVLFLNPDTICNQPALQHLVSRVLSEPAIGLITPRLVQADGEMDLACRRSIPTAWDGFCRGVGLSGRFPRSKRFAGYNLTYLPERETYPVGAINGAFMLGRRSVLAKVASPMVPQVFDESFFMYGDDLDLCVRVAQAGFQLVYDGRYDVVHLKGQSVAKDYDKMSVAIFDANRDVYLKHFGKTPVARWKWRCLFGMWKRLALWRASRRGSRRVRPA
ncbi:glycosyltransferase family 2 protein [Actomonas aquatica]|uniref:Glycosyltransferase family 2 protein n=1 Tax=Actomonas aquatica TaxID=2866162 RepID=A0ABZ1CA96_9BACT|nr:glycosyltransferase family 2 protein [Opitutus sp. WL0086]WRQ88396.1 glycosyltransferase family 2 protein [Opitutus sp. WL0086]